MLFGLGRDGGGFGVDDLTTWKTKVAVDSSYSEQLRVSGATFQGYGLGAGINLVFVPNLELVDSQIVGFKKGLILGTNTNIRDSHFHNTDVDVEISHSIATTGTTTLDTVTFGDDFNNIMVNWDPAFTNRDFTRTKDYLVYNYNGVEGDDFQIYMEEQAADYVMPYSPPVLTGTSHLNNRFSPVEGATNAELWETHRIAAAGRLIPEGAVQRPGISGYTAPILSGLTPPEVFDVEIEATATSLIVRWKTTELATSQLEWREWDAGGIRTGSWANVLPADTELKTEHEMEITGLDSGVKYNILIRSVDAFGNLGGLIKDVNSNYLGYGATTLAEPV